MDITQLLFNRPTVRPSSPAEQAERPASDAGNQAQTAEQLRAASRQFETILMHQVVKQMNQTVEHASLDEEDESGEQIQGMYWSFMADAMGQQGGFGLWKTLYEDLARGQGIDIEQFPAEGIGLNEQG